MCLLAERLWLIALSLFYCTVVSHAHWDEDKHVRNVIRLLDAQSQAQTLVDEARYFIVPRVWKRLLNDGKNELPSRQEGVTQTNNENTLGIGGCVGWHQTAGCSPTGHQERVGDCHETIPEGSSGYCECSRPPKRLSYLKPLSPQSTREWMGPGFGCNHKPFTCTELCAIRKNATLTEAQIRSFFATFLQDTSEEDSEPNQEFHFPNLDSMYGYEDEDSDIEDDQSYSIPTFTNELYPFGPEEDHKAADDVLVRPKGRAQFWMGFGAKRGARHSEVLDWVQNKQEIGLDSVFSGEGITHDKAASKPLSKYLLWDPDNVEEDEEIEEDTQRTRGVPKSERLPLPTLTYVQEANLKVLQRQRMKESIMRSRQSKPNKLSQEPHLEVRDAEYFLKRRQIAEKQSSMGAFHRYNSILQVRLRQQQRDIAYQRYRMLRQTEHLFGSDAGAGMGFFARYLNKGEVFENQSKRMFVGTKPQRRSQFEDESLELQKLHEFDYALPKESAGESEGKDSIGHQHHNQALPATEEIRAALRRYLTARERRILGQGGHDSSNQISAEETTFLNSQLVSRVLIDALPTSDDIWRNASLQSSPQAALHFISLMSDTIVKCRVRRLTRTLLSRKVLVDKLIAVGPMAGSGPSSPVGAERHKRILAESKALAVLPDALNERDPTTPQELVLVFNLFHRFMRGWAHWLDEALIGPCDSGDPNRPHALLPPTLDGASAFSLDAEMHTLIYGRK